ASTSTPAATRRSPPRRPTCPGPPSTTGCAAWSASSTPTWTTSSPACPSTSPSWPWNPSAGIPRGRPHRPSGGGGPRSRPQASEAHGPPHLVQGGHRPLPRLPVALGQDLPHLVLPVLLPPLADRPQEVVDRVRGQPLQRHGSAVPDLLGQLRGRPPQTQ